MLHWQKISVKQQCENSATGVHCMQPTIHSHTHSRERSQTYWHCHNAACGSNSGNGWQGAAADIFIAARSLFKLFRIAFEIVAVTVAAAGAPRCSQCATIAQELRNLMKFNKHQEQLCSRCRFTAFPLCSPILRLSRLRRTQRCQTATWALLNFTHATLPGKPENECTRCRCHQYWCPCLWLCHNLIPLTDCCLSLPALLSTRIGCKMFAHLHINSSSVCSQPARQQLTHTFLYFCSARCCQYLHLRSISRCFFSPIAIVAVPTTDAAPFAAVVAVGAVVARLHCLHKHFFDSTHFAAQIYI